MKHKIKERMSLPLGIMGAPYESRHKTQTEPKGLYQNKYRTLYRVSKEQNTKDDLWIFYGRALSFPSGTVGRTSDTELLAVCILAESNYLGRCVDWWIRLEQSILSTLQM